MFQGLFRFIVLIGTLTVAGSMGASPIFCDQFEGEPCLDLPRIMLAAPDLEIFESGELLLELQEPAPPGGLEVFLSSSEATILDVPGSVTVPQYQSELAIPVSTDAAYGAVRIVATATGYRTAIAEMFIALPSIEFLLNPLIEVGHTSHGEIKLSRAAPEGGLTVMLGSSDPSLVSTSPAQVSIAEGDQTAPISITGTGSGLAELSASAPAYPEATMTVRSTYRIVNIGTVPELVPGERRGLSVSLTEPAPAGGLAILLESADPAIATVDALIEIPEGRSLPNANAEVNGITLGSTVITAQVEGFAPISRPVTVGKFQLGFSPDPVPIFVGWTMPVTVTLSKPAPVGGLEISLTNQDDTIISAPDSIMVPAGQTSAILEVTALNPGSSSLLAQANDNEEASVEITVGPKPDINLESLSVGKDLEVSHTVSLSHSPPGPVDLLLTVTDPTIAVISADWRVLGSGSINFSNVGGNVNRSFYVQGLSQGSTTITASAAGFNEVEATLTITDSGFYIDSPTSISTTPYSNLTQVIIRSAQLLADGSWGADQVVRVGVDLPIHITSSNPGVGQIINSPVMIFTDYGFVFPAQFKPYEVGTATISLTQPPGFTAPNNRNHSIEAEVHTPDITLNDFAVGQDLQSGHFVHLNHLRPEPVDLVLSVADPEIAVISTERTTVGSDSITYSNVGGTRYRNFFVQGLIQGSTTITAAAAGYSAVEATITVTDSGFYIAGPRRIWAIPDQSPQGVWIRVAQLDADGWSATDQEVRAGVNVEVPISSADPDVGQITPGKVEFQAGLGPFLNAQFEPIGAGDTTVDLTQPAGFSAPTLGYQSIQARVLAPAILFTDFAVGKDLQDQRFIRLGQPPPEPIDLVLTVADPTIAVISTERTSIGSESVTFNNIAGADNQRFFVQGLSQGTTLIRAAAEGYPEASRTVTVTDSGFYISSPTSISTSPDASPTSIWIRAARIHSDGSDLTAQEIRAGLSVDVPVASANSGIGQITTSPVRFEAGNDLSIKTLFNPNTVGTTTVYLNQPVGFTAPAVGNELIDVEVRAPGISLGSFFVSDFNVGKDLQAQHEVRLGQSPSEPVDLVLTVADPAIALISTERTTLGSGSITYKGVGGTSVQHFFVQGLSQGSTTIKAAAAGFDEVEATLNVTGSGFYIDSPSSISTTTYSGSTSIRVIAGRVGADGALSNRQEVRAGLTIEVPIASADPGVGHITTNPVVFESGLGSTRTTRFDPSTVGTTIINLTQPTGFTAPANRRQLIHAEVLTPYITLGNRTVGKDLQTQQSVRLRQSPPAPVDLVLTVADPTIAVISTGRTTVGSGSITYSDVSGNGSHNFFVQGLSQGTTTIAAAAAGYDDIEATVTVVNSGFYIDSPSAISTTTYSNSTNITINATMLPHWFLTFGQEVRAGLTVEVSLVSADPAVGHITSSPLVFEAGQGASITTQFDPNTVGETIVNLTQPAGFAAPRNSNQWMLARVSPPNINLNDLDVGRNLQALHSLRLSQSPPDPVDLVLTVADPAIARISTDRTVLGGGSINFGGIGNTDNQHFFVQGLSQGTTTITAVAAGYDEVEATFTVTGSGFYIDNPASIETTAYSPPSGIRVRAAQLHANGLFSTAAREVRAGLTVEVPIASADPEVGQITTSPLVFEAASGYTRTTSFEPNAAGFTTVSLTQPAGFTAPGNRNVSIEAVVLD